MTTLLQAIGTILRRVEPGSIVLEEMRPDSTCKAITLHKSGQALVLRPDFVAGAICPRPDCARSLSAPDRLFPLFNVEIPRITMMCDYIVFCENGKTSSDDAALFILHCELKSKNIDGSRQQLENGKLLTDYIVAMALHHIPIRKKPIIKHRGLVFSPKFDAPKGNLHKVLCRYEPWPDSQMDLPCARYRSGKEYPLSHFCA